MKQKNNFLPKWSLSQLQKSYKKEKNKKVKLRLLCAIHRKKGDTILDISEKVVLAKSTVHDHLKRFENGSKALLYDGTRPGKPPKLSEKQVFSLKQAIENSPKSHGFDTDFWSTALVRCYVKEKYGKTYTMYGTRKLLKRLGFSLQKPRPIHHKGNAEKQAKYKKNSNVQSKSLKDMATKSFFWMKARS